MKKLVPSLLGGDGVHTEHQCTVDGRDVNLHCGPLSEEDSSFIYASINVVLKLCRLYGFNQRGFNPDKIYHHWANCAFQCDTVMSFVKYKLAAYYSAVNTSEGDEQEEVPLPKLKPGVTRLMDNPAKLLCGKAARWMWILQSRRKIGSDDPHTLLAESFSESLLMSKKGMPRAKQSALAEASYQTFLDLTTPRVSDDLTHVLLCGLDHTDGNEKFIPDKLNWESCELVIRRTVKEMFKGERLTEEDLTQPFIPSKNSHFHYARKAFGALGRTFIDEREELMGDLDMVCNIKQSIQNSGITNKRGWRNPVNPTTYDVSKLRNNFATIYNRVVTKAVKEEPFAKPLSLAEALKIRTITTGPSAIYFALRPLQKKLWKVVSSNECFKLTSRPIDWEYIQSRMGKKLDPRKKFASIDYKNATNMIDSRASDIVCDEISKQMNLDPHLSYLFRMSLTGHQIIDPSKKTLSWKKQQNGQLMGSVTSFPVLCIINAAMCRWALELDSGKRFAQRISLKEAKLCINGDDAVMPVSANGLAIWERVTKFVGLSKSIGKVYYSRNFLNMNSACYRYRETPWYQDIQDKTAGQEPIVRDVHFRKTEFINLGLLLGLKRAGGVDRQRDGTVGARARDLVSSCPNLCIDNGVDKFNLKEKVLSSFINHNIEELKSHCVPWFIPEDLGGLGLPCVGKFQPRELDLRLCRKIYEHFRLPRRDVADWPLWSFAMKRLKPPTDMEYLQLQEFSVGKGFESRQVSYVELLTLETLNVLMSTSYALERFEINTIKSALEKDPHNASHILALNSYKAKGHELSNGDYGKRVAKLWNKALKDKTIPLPERFGLIGSNPTTGLTEYDYPVQYDIHSLPLLPIVEIGCEGRL